MNQHQSVYFWLATFIAAPLGVFLVLAAVVGWRRLKSPREHLGSEIRPGDNSADASCFWLAFGLTGLVLCTLARDWAVRLGADSGILSSSDSAGLIVFGICSVAAATIYFFAWPSILVPPGFRGDVGRVQIWREAVRRRRGRGE